MSSSDSFKEERFLDVPDDSLVRDERADLLLGVVDVFVAIGELGTERVGVPFDVAGPPSADVVDRREDLLRGPVDGEGGGEVAAGHGLCLLLESWFCHRGGPPRRDDGAESVGAAPAVVAQAASIDGASDGTGAVQGS